MLIFRNPHSRYQGFTLIEVLAVIIIIGILAAIAAPTWLGFLDRQRLGAARAEVYQAFQSARSNAMKDKKAWQVSIREQEIAGQPRVQLAIHRADDVQENPNSVLWQTLEAGVRLDDETTLTPSSNSNPNPNPFGEHHYAIFNYTGCPATLYYHQCRGVSPGGVTLASDRQIQNNVTGNRRIRRCVIISTILGAMRLSKEQSTPRNGKFCY